MLELRCEDPGRAAGNSLCTVGHVYHTHHSVPRGEGRGGQARPVPRQRPCLETRRHLCTMPPAARGGERRRARCGREDGSCDPRQCSPLSLPSCVTLDGLLHLAHPLFAFATRGRLCGCTALPMAVKSRMYGAQMSAFPARGKCSFSTWQRLSPAFSDV